MRATRILLRNRNGSLSATEIEQFPFGESSIGGAIEFKCSLLLGKPVGFFHRALLYFGRPDDQTSLVKYILIAHMMKLFLYKIFRFVLGWSERVMSVFLYYNTWLCCLCLWDKYFYVNVFMLWSILKRRFHSIFFCCGFYVYYYLVSIIISFCSLKQAHFLTD